MVFVMPMTETLSRYHRDADPRSLRLRLVETLRDFPEGATCAQLSEVLGDFQYTISSIVSKMHCYGGAVEKVRVPHGIRGGSVTFWRLKRAAQ